MSSVNQESILPQNKECSIDYLAEALLKLEVTNDNYDDLFRLECLLKTHEDELRIKRQTVSYKLRRYYQDQYLEKHNKNVVDNAHSPIINNQIIHASS